MRLHSWCAAPPPEWSGALARFEEQFTYPLGPGRTFRIAHGDDYPRFFRAMGEGACFVVERQGEVLGTLGVALRRLLRPEGQVCAAVYLGDLKIAPLAGGGRTLVQLIGAAQQWAAGRAEVGYSVVMDGTAVTPPRYTGRLGIPAFHELDRILVLRVPTADAGNGGQMLVTDATTGSICHRRLSAGCHVCLDSLPQERSQMTPLWLMTADGRACGRLEDTRRAKRLIGDDGRELCSAHLSCFAFESLEAGAELLQTARRHAARLGFPALFTAIAPADAAAFCAALGEKDIVPAPATVYGSGLSPGPWNINTAEI